MTAMMRRRAAPMASISSTIASSTPATAPRQPAWAAPTTRAAGSANSTGAQSAVTMPSAMPGAAVAMASASGRLSQPAVASTARAPWTCRRARNAPAPSAAWMRWRFSATAAGSSSERSPALRLA